MGGRWAAGRASNALKLVQPPCEMAGQSVSGRRARQNRTIPAATRSARYSAHENALSGQPLSYPSRTHAPAGMYLYLSTRFTDVYSTEDWALAMVPQPVLGVVMLFPIKESTEKYREEEAARVRDSEETPSPNLYYM